GPRAAAPRSREAGPRTYRNPVSGGVFHPGISGIAQLALTDRVGDCFLGSFPPVAQRAVADSQLAGDLGERDAFEPVAADQLGLRGGEDAACHGSGEDEVGVAPGHAGGVVTVVEVAAA